MKAAVFKALGQPLCVETLPDPVPGPDEVLVKVGRCGICGTDLHITEDAIFGAPPGVVLGHEFAGEVVETGTKVGGLRKGDRLTLDWVPGVGTVVALNQKPLLAPIADRSVYNALLNVWLGAKPADSSLKTRLLGLSPA